MSKPNHTQAVTVRTGVKGGQFGGQNHAQAQLA
jgi:hypothetical protein